MPVAAVVLELFLVPTSEGFAFVPVLLLLVATEESAARPAPEASLSSVEVPAPPVRVLFNPGLREEDAEVEVEFEAGPPIPPPEAADEPEETEYGAEGVKRLFGKGPDP